LGYLRDLGWPIPGRGALRFAAALSVVWLSFGALGAQKLEDLNRDPIGTAVLTGDRHLTRVRLMISDPPSAEDVIFVSSSIGKVQVTLISPGGQRITSANGAAVGPQKWKITAEFRCEGVVSHARLVGLPVDVASSEYDARPANPILAGTDLLGVPPRVLDL
jgi:hypothetical protein